MLRASTRVSSRKMFSHQQPVNSIVNSCLISDSFPLPKVNETLDKLSGKRFFSTLDASAEYWTIPMEDASKEYRAFNTLWGLFHFLVMPLGLSSAGAVYSQFVQQVLDEGVSREDVEAYLDDIVLATKEGKRVSMWSDSEKYCSNTGKQGLS